MALERLDEATWGELFKTFGDSSLTSHFANLADETLKAHRNLLLLPLTAILTHSMDSVLIPTLANKIKHLEFEFPTTRSLRHDHAITNIDEHFIHLPLARQV